MKIRPGRAEDAAAVADLWTEAYTDDPRGGRATPYAPVDFWSATSAGTVLVADDGSSHAGVVVLYGAGARSRQVTQEGEAELSRLAVATCHRRRGIGRRLIASCLGLATERGASALVLWSQPHQVEAHKLYASLGFRRLPDRDEEDVTGPRLVFGRRL